MKQSRIVVLGAGYSGLLAAIRAAKLARSWGEVVLVSDQDRFVERVRLHEEAVHGRKIRWPIERLIRGTGVKFRCAMVLAIDPPRSTVMLTDGELMYDKLIVTLGSSVDMDRQPPGAREHAIALEPETTGIVSGHLTRLSQSGGRVSICGGGLLGVELAAEIAEAFPTVHVSLTTAGEVAPLLGQRARTKLRQLLSCVPVRLYENMRVERIERDHVRAARQIPHDLCLTAAGMRACPVPARSGLRVNATGQIVVDPFLRALGWPDIYAAGDAAFPAVPPGDPVAMGCKYGMPMAAVAASNAVANLEGRREHAFDFADTHFIVSVGRHRAVVKLNKPGLVFDGPLAVWAKELVTHSTIWAIRAERFRAFGYPYLRTGNAPERLATDAVPPTEAAR